MNFKLFVGGLLIGIGVGRAFANLVPVTSEVMGVLSLTLLICGMIGTPLLIAGAIDYAKR